MSKHRHQSKEEQINNRAHDTAPVQHDRSSYQKKDMIKPENNQIKAVIEQSSIQERAYQIHSEKGGSPLDNWLEAERILNNNHSGHSGLNDKKTPLLFQKTNGKPAKADIYR